MGGANQVLPYEGRRLAKSESNEGAPIRGPLPHLLDIRRLAEHLGVNERHIRRLVAERRIPFIKWGHLVRFDPDEVHEWLDVMRRAPA